MSRAARTPARREILHDGQRMDVRDPDGIHLDVAATAIAARVVEAAITGFLGR